MPIPGLSHTDEQLFSLIWGCLPAWILLIVAPSNKLSQAICMLTAFLYSIMYILLMVSLFTQPGSNVVAQLQQTLNSLDGVRLLFNNPATTLAAWVHYIAGDLWVGHWVALDAARRGVPKLIMAPVLAATCMLMPFGLAGYFIIRTPWKPARPTAGRAKRD